MSIEEPLGQLTARRDSLLLVLRDVAAGRVSRDYGGAELADLLKEVDRLNAEISARQLGLET